MSQRVLKTAISGIVLLSLAFSIALGAGTGNNRTQAAPPADPSPQSAPVTPFQAAVQNALRQRPENDRPEVTFDNQATAAFNQAPAVQGLREQAAQPSVITATTTLMFDGPEQAGYDQWPRLSAQDLPPGAVAPDDDLNETLRRLAEENLPGIWDERPYGSEARRYTITETLTYSPGEGISSATQVLGTNATPEDILMGFTMSGPHLDYSIDKSIDVCIPLLWPPWYKCWEVAAIRAGLVLDWGFGLRLPGEATMDGPAQLVQGDFNSDVKAALTPSNWDEAQYESYSVRGHDGNEWVAFIDFFVGVKAELFGEELCPFKLCNVEVDEDYSSDFPTPFGTGAYFPIPSAEVELWKISILGLGFSIWFGIQPLIGSNQISADWVATGDARGSGRIYFTAPGGPVEIGPIQGCNLSDSEVAQIELSTFRYWFNQFLLRFFLNFKIDLFGLGGWDFDVSLYTLNLSSWMPEMYLGKHYACDWKFSCGASGPDNVLALTVPVVDQKPPVVSITEPVSRVYNNTETFTVNWTATDDLPGCPGSGIASETGILDGEPIAKGTVVELLLVGAGMNIFEVEVIDQAGNVGRASVVFNMVTDLDGLIAALDRMCELGWVNKPGICKSLQVKLDQAKTSIGRGQMNTAANQLEAFMHEVDAQNGKALSQRAHDALLADVLYVIRRLEIPDECPDDEIKTEPGMCGCGVAETDTDSDGTPDCLDSCPADPGKIAAGFCGCGVAETDGDGDFTPDCADACPADPGKIAVGFCGCGVAETDEDLDGRPDCADNCPKDPQKLEPGDCGCGVADTDSDGDGTVDCQDVCPQDGNKTDDAGLCGCGVADADSDGDGTVDCQDVCPQDGNKTEAGLCGCGVPETDTDGDTTPDCVDQCWEDPGKTSPGQCGCGEVENLTDSDGNGIPDCVDITDTDGDGTYDYLDACPADPGKVVAGICGCGVADTDTDGDGTPDCVDACPVETDTDGDGVPDCFDECPVDKDKIEAGDCGCGVPETPDCPAPGA